MREIREYWLSLTLRERVLLGIGVGVALGMAIFIGLIEPLNTALEQTRTTLQRHQDLYEWIQPQVKEIQALMTPDRQDVVVRLSSIEESARENQLHQYLIRLAVLDQDEIEIIFNNAPYQSIMRWLEHLEQEFGSIIRSVILSATPTPGRIDTHLTLTLRSRS